MDIVVGCVEVHEAAEDSVGVNGAAKKDSVDPLKDLAGTGKDGDIEAALDTPVGCEEAATDSLPAERRGPRDKAGTVNVVG